MSPPDVRSADHYPCMQQSCLEQKFVVFPNEMDLRAHLVSAVGNPNNPRDSIDAQHGENMSARDRAQARQLPIDFQSHADSRRGGSSRHEAHSGGRGFTMNRAPQAQTLSSAPAMTAEQAAQQRRQIQTDRQEESRRRKGFETGLTDSRREQTSLANPDAGGSRSGYNTPREDVDDATAGWVETLCLHEPYSDGQPARRALGPYGNARQRFEHKAAVIPCCCPAVPKQRVGSTRHG